MDKILSSEIQASLAAVEEQLKEMSDLSKLNSNLRAANEGLSGGADALASAALEFPDTLKSFKSLSERLGALAQILEGSDLAVLVNKVNKLEEDLKAANSLTAKSGEELKGALEAQSLLSRKEQETKQLELQDALTARQETILEQLKKTNELLQTVFAETHQLSAVIKISVGIAAALIIATVIFV